MSFPLGGGQGRGSAWETFSNPACCPIQIDFSKYACVPMGVSFIMSPLRGSLHSELNEEHLSSSQMNGQRTTSISDIEDT